MTAGTAHTRVSAGGSAFARFVLRVCLVMMAVAAVVVVVVDHGFGTAAYQPVTRPVSNAVLSVCVLAVVGVLAGVGRAVGRRRAVGSERAAGPELAADPERAAGPEHGMAARVVFCVELLATAVLLAFQVFSFFKAGVLSGWDALGVTTSALTDLPLSQNLGDDLNTYLVHFPNNQFLVWVLHQVQGLCKALFSANGPAPTSALAIFSCCCVSLGVLITARAAYRLTASPTVSLITHTLGILLVGLNPWFMIPYTDTVCLPLVAATLYMGARLLTTRRLQAVVLFCLGAFGILSFRIKPTALLVFAALVVLVAIPDIWRRATGRAHGWLGNSSDRDKGGAHGASGGSAGGSAGAKRGGAPKHFAYAVDDRKNTGETRRASHVSQAPYVPSASPAKRWGRAAVEVAALLAGCAVAFVLTATATRSLGLASYEREDSIPLEYFLVFGLSDVGTWNVDDHLMTLEQPDYQSRQAVEREAIVRRLEDMGWGGFARHALHKFMRTYNDGTFAWGGEGNFFYQTVGTDDVFGKALQALWYPGGAGNELFSTVCQVFWLATLFGLAAGCIASFVPGRLREQGGRVGVVAACAVVLVGLTVYLILFETRARYLYHYAPVFLCLATWGYWTLFGFGRNHH